MQAIMILFPEKINCSVTYTNKNMKRLFTAITRFAGFRFKFKKKLSFRFELSQNLTDFRFDLGVECINHKCFKLKYEKILTSIIHLIKINKRRNQSK